MEGMRNRRGFLTDLSTYLAMSPVVTTLKPFVDVNNLFDPPGYPIATILKDLNAIEAQIAAAGTGKLPQNQQNAALAKLDLMNYPESVRLEQKKQAETMAAALLTEPNHRQKLLDCATRETDGVAWDDFLKMSQFVADRYAKNYLDVTIQVNTQSASAPSRHTHKGIDENTSLIALNYVEADISSPKHLAEGLGVFYHELSHSYQRKLADDYTRMPEAEKARIEEFIRNDYRDLVKENPEDPKIQQADAYLAGKMNHVGGCCYGGLKGWAKHPTELNAQIAAEYFTDRIIQDLGVEPNLAKKMDKRGGFELAKGFKTDLARIAEQIDYSPENPGSLQGLPVKITRGKTPDFP